MQYEHICINVQDMMQYGNIRKIIWYNVQGLCNMDIIEKWFTEQYSRYIKNLCNNVQDIIQ